MSRAQRAAAALPTVARLAEQTAPPLGTAYRALQEGALTGPAGTRLFHALADRHRDVRAAFTDALDQLEHLAATDPSGPPRTRRPHLPGPARGGPRGTGDERSGSPTLLGVLAADLDRIGRDWRAAGRTLTTILTGLGLGGAPGARIERAGGWAAAQRPDLDRRRDELLATDRQPVLTATGTATATATGGGVPIGQALKQTLDLYGNHYLRGVWDGGSEIALSALAGNPMTAPFYLSVDADGWLDHSPIGQLKGLIGGVQHPVAFAKAMVDWEEWAKDPVRAFGHLVPGIVLAVLTGGLGAPKSGGVLKRVTALRRPKPPAAGEDLTATSPKPPPRPARPLPPDKPVAGKAKPPALPEPGDKPVAGAGRKPSDGEPGDKPVAGAGKRSAGPGRGSAGGDVDIDPVVLPAARLAEMAKAAGGLRGLYEQRGSAFAGTAIGDEAKAVPSGRRAFIARRVVGLGLPQQATADVVMAASARLWGEAGEMRLPNGDIAVVPGHPGVPDTFVVSPDGKVTITRSRRWWDPDAGEQRIEILD
ncbi:hypothetical protein [Actinomadura parmotrematis]|uniref:WXG100 family type VII secretion target n=1 Tax=Actinomadura parmotrematis TaxID=2864039 RepID=A0ABS7FNJ5_9ACTN|nr:hypothetical protein [Actinomadura parmotrematis]MBW8481954.1 hypothetical protein [Actinomadura parmotrematis]